MINALALRNGAHVIAATNSRKMPDSMQAYIPKNSPEALMDENLKNGWSSVQGKPRQCSFVFELAETFLLKKIGFNNKQAPKNRRQSVKKVRIEFSNKGHNRGFDVEYTVILEADSPVRLMEIQNIKTRWVKITILTNYGSADFSHLNEIQAWGVYAKPDKPHVNLTGTWHTPKGVVSLKQKGNKVTGCYPNKGGSIVNGKINGRYLIFDWNETTTKTYGQATLVINQEQNILYGIWNQGSPTGGQNAGTSQQPNQYGSWMFEKKSDEASVCPDLRKEGQAQTRKK